MNALRRKPRPVWRQLRSREVLGPEATLDFDIEILGIVCICYGRREHNDFRYTKN